MEIKDIYIPSEICKKENISVFYEYYYGEASDMFWNTDDKIKWRDSLLNKADELNEPQLKEFLKTQI